MASWLGEVALCEVALGEAALGEAALAPLRAGDEHLGTVKWRRGAETSSGPRKDSGSSRVFKRD